MMYINIKKLYSWRIRPYKIPSFFFPLLFPFFSLFSSLFFFPPSSPLFPFFPPHGVRVCPSLSSVPDRAERHLKWAAILDHPKPVGPPGIPPVSPMASPPLSTPHLRKHVGQPC